MIFKVKALRETDEMASLVLEAENADDAASQARQRGYRVLRVTPDSVWHGRKASRFPLATFNIELKTLLDAGLTLVESLEALADKEVQVPVRQQLKGVLDELYKGQPLSCALQLWPQSFPGLYIAVIRASERTGNISESLERYIAYQSQVDAVRKKIMSAAIYPVLLLGVGGLVILFLLIYVIPRFSLIFEEIQGSLPLLSRWLLAWGGLVNQHGLFVVATMLLSGLLLLGSSRHPGMRRWLWAQVLFLAPVRQTVRTYQLSQLYRTLGMLLRGGIPVVTGLNMTKPLLPPALQGNLEQALCYLAEGKSIAQAMSQCDLTTPVALRFLQVGERSGQMGEMMDRLAAFHDEEIARRVDWFTRIFEPVLMAVVGIVIGVIVILMYMPIFQLAGSIQ